MTTTIKQRKEQQQEHYDVIVIGAGAAGLTATYELITNSKNSTSNCCKVLLLEASNRIGGRLKKAPKDTFSPNINFPIDLGGEWIQYMCVCVCVCVHSTSRT